MSSDYSYQTIKSYKIINGIEVPMDEYRHYLDWNDVRGNEACDLTSPYGALEFAIGSGDDFHCFDYAELPNGAVALHSVVNSETGGFIQDADYQVVHHSDAVDVASGFVDQALEWLCWSGDRPLRHTTRGWNQDPYYFVRAVARSVKDPRISWWKGARIVRGAKAHSWMTSAG